MVTYYIGNIRDKRKYFRRKREYAASADNCDVLADFRLGGKICFVLGDIPYGDMRVGEYLGYACALKTRLPLNDAAAKEMLRRVGLRVNLDRKLRRLPREIFRVLLLATAVESSTREVWLNLDGVAYSFFSRKRIRRMVRRMKKNYENVHVAVSDVRFIPRRARVLAASSGAMLAGKPRSCSRLCGRMRLRRATRKSNLALSALSGRKMLLCDN